MLVYPSRLEAILACLSKLSGMDAIQANYEVCKLAFHQLTAASSRLTAGGSRYFVGSTFMEHQIDHSHHQMRTPGQDSTVSTPTLMTDLAPGDGVSTNWALLGA